MRPPWRPARRLRCFLYRQKRRLHEPPSSHAFMANSELNPDAVAVIAAAFVIVAVMTIPVGIPTLVEVPIVIVKIEAQARCPHAIVGMPAITFAVANDIGRGVGRGQNPRADDRAEKQLLDGHGTSPLGCRPSGKKTALPGRGSARFPGASGALTRKKN